MVACNVQGDTLTRWKRNCSDIAVISWNVVFIWVKCAVSASCTCFPLHVLPEPRAPPAGWLATCNPRVQQCLWSRCHFSLTPLPTKSSHRATTRKSTVWVISIYWHEKLITCNGHNLMRTLKYGMSPRSETRYTRLICRIVLVCMGPSKWLTSSLASGPNNRLS
jgi:hypothetical protein